MDKIKILWAVPCSYYGSETLSDLYKFFISKEMGEIQFIGVYDGAKAAQKIHDQKFDLIVLGQKLDYIAVAEAFLERSFLINCFVIRLSENGELKFEGVDRRGMQMFNGLEGSFRNINEILEKIFCERGEQQWIKFSL